MNGLAMRLGAQACLWDARFGVCLRNLGGNVRGAAGEYALPGELSLGVERALGRLATVSFGATIDRNREARFHGGTRWTAPGGFALLAGAAYDSERFERPFSPRGGVELGLRAFCVSYGYVPDGELGATHHLSLQFPGPGNRSWHREAPPPAHVIAQGNDAPMVADTQAPRSWAVWGGTYRTEAGAKAEIRALRVERIDDAGVVVTPDGLFRVRIATSLTAEEARLLAQRLRATYSEE
jgi:hypothetical protein